MYSDDQSSKGDKATGRKVDFFNKRNISEKVLDGRELSILGAKNVTGGEKSLTADVSANAYEPFGQVIAIDLGTAMVAGETR